MFGCLFSHRDKQLKRGSFQLVGDDGLKVKGGIVVDNRVFAVRFANRPSQGLSYRMTHNPSTKTDKQYAKNLGSAQSFAEDTAQLSRPRDMFLADGEHPSRATAHKPLLIAEALLTAEDRLSRRSCGFHAVVSLQVYFPRGTA